MCQQCKYNGSFYNEEELGPYSKFNIPHGPHQTCKITIQEPLDINPSGTKNLTALYENIPDYYPPDFQSFPVAGDALPTVTYHRMSHDHVICRTHDALIKLSEPSQILEHLTPLCHIDWPFSNLHFIVGDSHEVSYNV